MGPRWVCFIMCPLWLWALWQLVELEFFVCWQAADFCLTGRKLDSERKKKRRRKREMGWHCEPSCKYFCNPLRLKHNLALATQALFSFTCVLFSNLHTHFCFSGFHHAHWSLHSSHTHSNAAIFRHTLIIASLSPCGWSQSASTTASRCQSARSHHT